jgi:hypothetical protein
VRWAFSRARQDGDMGEGGKRFCRGPSEHIGAASGRGFSSSVRRLDQARSIHATLSFNTTSSPFLKASVASPQQVALLLGARSCIDSSHSIWNRMLSTSSRDLSFCSPSPSTASAFATFTPPYHPPATNRRHPWISPANLDRFCFPTKTALQASPAVSGPVPCKVRVAGVYPSPDAYATLRCICSFPSDTLSELRVRTRCFCLLSPTCTITTRQTDPTCIFAALREMTEETSATRLHHARTF